MGWTPLFGPWIRDTRRWSGIGIQAGARSRPAGVFVSNVGEREKEREKERERNSTGNSLTVLHSVFLSFIMAAIFSSVGKAIAPAVAAIYSGDSAASPSSEQNSLVNACAASAHARSGSANSRA